MENEDTSVIYRSIDEITLIQQVKIRPVLWDSMEDKYRKREPCDQAWEEVLKYLFPDYEVYANDRKALLTKEAKKKWTNLRDGYNKSRKAGKESASKYKILDFLGKVFDEKEKKSFVSPSKSSGHIADPDADTQLNSALYRKSGAASSHTSSQVASDKTNFGDYFSEPARPKHVINRSNIKAECDSPKYDSDSSDDEDMKDIKPQCSTTSNGGKTEQYSVRRGEKRRLEENKTDEGDEHFLQFVKKSLTKNFNTLQAKRFRSEILLLLESVSNDFDDAEMEDFNIELLKFLLSIKNVDTKFKIYKKIMACVEEAEKE